MSGVERCTWTPVARSRTVVGVVGIPHFLAQIRNCVTKNAHSAETNEQRQTLATQHRTCSLWLQTPDQSAYQIPKILYANVRTLKEQGFCDRSKCETYSLRRKRTQHLVLFGLGIIFTTWRNSAEATSLARQSRKLADLVSRTTPNTS